MRVFISMAITERNLHTWLKLECLPWRPSNAATVVNAGILGMCDKIGTLEQGKLADIVATDENPLQNIKTMEKVSFVMKEGVIYKQ